LLRPSCNDDKQQNVRTGNNKQQPKPNEERQQRIMERAQGQMEKSKAKQLLYKDIMAD
jgi:hypothetical protein